MTTSLKLYEIADEYVAVIQALEENGGELTPDLAAQLDAVQAAFPEKAERVALYVQNLASLATAATEEARRLSELAGQRQRAVESLKGYLKTQMERLGKVKIETPLITLRIQVNGRPSIKLPEGCDIPAGYERVTVSLDGQKAYEAWKEAGSLPAPFIVERGSHLRLK